MISTRAKPTRLTPWFLGGAVWLLCAWFFPYFSNLGSPNELSRLYLTRSILDDGSLSVDGSVSRYGPINDLSQANGHLYTDKAPGVSLAGIPVYAFVLFTHGFNGASVSNEELLRWMRILLAGLPTALIAMILFSLLGQLKLERPWRLLLVMGYSLGTVAFPYGVLLFGHQLTTLCLVSAFSLSERYSRTPTKIAPVAVGALLGCALVIEYTSILLAFPLAIYFLWNSPRKLPDLGLAIAGSLPPLFLLLWYQLSAFGSPWGVGYGHLLSPAYAQVHGQGLFGLTAPSLERLSVILLSPNKGLFFYSPWLILSFVGFFFAIRWPISPAWRKAWILLAVSAVLYLVFSASLDLMAWGWSLGARHLAPLVPFLVLAAGALISHTAKSQPWFQRALRVLVPVSIILTVLPTATFGGFPPDFSNPVADFSLPLFLQGCFPASIGTSLGLSPAAAAVPFFLILLGLLFWLAWIGVAARWEKLICLLLAILLIGSVICFKGPQDPLESRALRWAQHDILRCIE